MAKVSDVVKGLEILAKYNPDGMESHDICAEHDIIYAFPGIGEDAPSPEDKIKMDEFGWHYDSGSDSWARFV